jgi:hypothetical protein
MGRGGTGEVGSFGARAAAVAAGDGGDDLARLSGRSWRLIGMGRNVGDRGGKLKGALYRRASLVQWRPEENASAMPLMAVDEFGEGISDGRRGSTGRWPSGVKWGRAGSFG